MWDRNAHFSCTRSIPSNSERAKAKELHSFTTVSSVIWMTPPDRQGPDAARQWISLLSHLSEVDFQEVRVIAGIKELHMHRGREWLLETGCPKQQDNIENFGSHIKHKHWHKVCHYLRPIPVSVHANRDTELKQTNQCRADGDRSLSYMPLAQWELHYIETIYTEIYMWCQYFK